MDKRFLAGIIGAAAALLSACGASAPVKIGADTYYSSKTNGAGAFGDPARDAQTLMVKGNQFCAAQSKEFELVTSTIDPSRVASSLGGASITFKCVAHANSPVMRKDNGVTN